MRAFAALVSFEFGRRRMLLLAAAILGVLACVLPSLGPGAQASDVREAAAMAFALSILGLGSLLIGTSFLSEDLASKRYSFYFSSPLSSLSIFASRLAGAAAIVVLSTLLTLLPATLLDLIQSKASQGFGMPGRSAFGTSMPAFTDLGTVGLLATAAALLLLAAGNALGLAGRARDAWILLEISSVLVLTGGLAVSRSVLDVPRSVMFEVGILPVTALLFGLGLLLAAFVQVTAGRIDMSRARAAFALTTAAIALASATLAVTYSRHYASPNLANFDLSDLVETHSYDDRWVEARVRQAFPENLMIAYLVDRHSGRSLRLDEQARYWRPGRFESVQITEDGREGFWMDLLRADTMTHRLLRTDLAAPDLRPTRVGLEIEGDLLDWKISADGAAVTTVTRLREVRPKYDSISSIATLVISVEKPDGTGALLSRTIEVPAAEYVRIVDVNQLGARLILKARSWVRELEIMEAVDWTSSSVSCSDSASGFMNMTDSSSYDQLIEIDVTFSNSEPKIRRRPLPVGWSEPWIMFGEESNILLASVQGSLAILDRSSHELLWCHQGPTEDYFFDQDLLARPLPGRRFAVTIGPRTARSLLIIDDRGTQIASVPWLDNWSKPHRPPLQRIVAGRDSLELLSSIDSLGRYVVHRIGLPSGEVTEIPIAERRLDRTQFLLPPTSWRPALPPT